MEIKKVLRKFCPSGSFIHFSLSSCRLVFLSSCLPVILSSCLPVVLSSCRSVSWRRHLFAWEDQNTKRLNRTPFHRTIQSRIQFFKILFFTATNTIQASNEATYLLARWIESSVVIYTYFWLARGKEKDTHTENPQLRGRHSRLNPLSHCGETLSLKSGIGARQLMSTISI